MDLDPQDRLVKINAPSVGYLGGMKTRRQGPFLVQPESVELSSEIESFACDIAYISYTSLNSTTGTSHAYRETNGGALGVFVISYNDGKVDLCLEVEKVEARWLEKNDSRSRVSVDADGEVSPLLVIYETIDLGLLSELEQASNSSPSSIATTIDSNWTTIVKDPLYSDTIYIHHSLGAHCLILSRWLDDLADFTQSSEEDSDLLQKEVERNLKVQKETEVIWILKTITGEFEGESFGVESLNIINDVYLGYSLIIITESLQLITIELGLRVNAELLPSLAESVAHADDQARAVSSEESGYVSVLDEPFIIPPPFDRKAGVSAVPRLAVKPPAGSNGELVITPASLRFLGKTVESFRGEIRSLVTGADIIQRRLELQMKELSTQLGKLKELSNLSNELRKSTANPDGLTNRMDRVKARQEALLSRTDRVLQKLMESHQPVISTFERKWFDELDSLSVEIMGNKNGRGIGVGSIVKRVERVEAQLEILKPGLEELKRKASSGEDKNSVGKNQMGKNQMKQLEEMLSEE